MNSRLIGLIKAFFIFIFVFYTIVSIEDIYNELEGKNRIFLHSSGYQEMEEEGLYVAIDGVEPYLTGLKIKGKILNALAVNRKDLSFKVYIRDKSGDFFIDIIPSGVAKNFEVYIPDADKDAEYALFEYENGVIEYEYYEK